MRLVRHSWNLALTALELEDTYFRDLRAHLKSRELIKTLE